MLVSPMASLHSLNLSNCAKVKLLVKIPLLISLTDVGHVLELANAPQHLRDEVWENKGVEPLSMPTLNKLANVAMAQVRRDEFYTNQLMDAVSRARIERETLRSFLSDSYRMSLQARTLYLLAIFMEDWTAYN